MKVGIGREFCRSGWNIIRRYCWNLTTTPWALKGIPRNCEYLYTETFGKDSAAALTAKTSSSDGFTSIRKAYSTKRTAIISLERIEYFVCYTPKDFRSGPSSKARIKLGRASRVCGMRCRIMPSIPGLRCLHSLYDQRPNWRERKSEKCVAIR